MVKSRIKPLSGGGGLVFRCLRVEVSLAFKQLDYDLCFVPEDCQHPRDLGGRLLSSSKVQTCERHIPVWGKCHKQYTFLAIGPSKDNL